MSRLDGNGITLRGFTEMDSLEVMKLPSMSEAVTRFKAGVTLFAKMGRKPKPTWWSGIDAAMIDGDAELPKILDHSDRLVEEAIANDPRLARKMGWVRSEDGVDACPGLLSAGDERPCYDRRRMKLGDASPLEPVKIVISTDSKEIHAENAAAFIATAKIAQQFRPLEIWWQGAWMKAGEEHRKGFVFLVPLVQGDCDWRRIQFVLGSRHRDYVSFNVMLSEALPRKISWDAGVASFSHLEGDHDFVSEKGITDDASYIAQRAAQWAGLEPWYVEYYKQYGAKQEWSDDPKRAAVITDEDRSGWEKQDRDRKAEALKQAKSRMADATSSC